MLTKQFIQFSNKSNWNTFLSSIISWRHIYFIGLLLLNDDYCSFFPSTPLKFTSSFLLLWYTADWSWREIVPHDRLNFRFSFNKYWLSYQIFPIASGGKSPSSFACPDTQKIRLSISWLRSGLPNGCYVTLRATSSCWKQRHLGWRRAFCIWNDRLLLSPYTNIGIGTG